MKDDEIIDFMGAKIKNLTTLANALQPEWITYRGVLVLEVAAGSGAAKFLQANDVILSFNYKQINKLRDLLEARMSVIGTNTEIVIFRNQKEMKKWVELKDKK